MGTQTHDTDSAPALTITYASEVCPVALRGYLTCYVNFCWGLGQVIGIGVIKSMLGREDEWAYRIPYGVSRPQTWLSCVG